MNVVFVSAEVAPFSKAGGLADVAGSLPGSIVSDELQCHVISPLYGQIDRNEYDIVALDIKGAVEYCSRMCSYQIWEAKKHSNENLKFWFVDHHEFFNRDGIYTDENGEGYPDNNERYFYFQFVILDLIQRKLLSPDILHCNDHHTGLLPLLSQVYAIQVHTVFTIHNFLYHGHFSVEEKEQLPTKVQKHLSPTQWNNYSALLEGIAHANRVTTVSQGYANELMAGENVDPHSLDVINARSDHILGILNGIDTVYWDPAGDQYLDNKYSIDDLSGKAASKAQLLKEVGLKADLKAPLLGSVSRLVENKGYSLIFNSMDHFIKRGVSYVFLGSGDPTIARQLKQYVKQYPGQVAFVDGFNEPLAHLIEAGSDMFLMPSRFEPCGLNQLYSLRYGTIPIVNRTGGLADSVEPWMTGKGTGFVFHPYDPEALEEALETAIKVYEDKSEWMELIKRAMQKDFSWAASASHYIKLYTSWK